MKRACAFHSSAAGTIFRALIALLLILGPGAAWSTENPIPPASSPSGNTAPSGTEGTHGAHGQTAGGSLASTASPPMSLREITLSLYAMKLAEIQTSLVERKFVEAEIRMVGKVEYDETRLGTITAWVPGRLDRLYVNFTGIAVQKGDPMVSLYSPDLLTAQTELLQAIRAVEEVKKTRLSGIRRTARQTVKAAREKLRLWGLTDRQIREIERRGTPSDHITIQAPMGGVVVHKNAFEGMYVQTGTRIYTIADLRTVWVQLDAYESDLVWIRPGQRVEFEVESQPGIPMAGTVSFINPILDEKTRTVKVRVEVANPEGTLKPGMFVRGRIRARLGVRGVLAAHDDRKALPPLVIPAAAPLITGKRAVVYVAHPRKPGTFIGREIVLGPRAGAWYVVRAGLRPGERVVTNGAFKIDSALQIQAKPSVMTPEGGGGGGGHHGGGPAKKAKGAASIRVKVPKPFASQVRQVLKTYGNIAAAVRGNDLLGARKAFGKLGAVLETVDSGLLSGHAAMLWAELAMLLRNDAVVGSRIRSQNEAEDALRSLADHIRRLENRFNMKGTSKAKGNV